MKSPVAIICNFLSACQKSWSILIRRKNSATSEIDFSSVPDKMSCQFSGIFPVNSWLNGKEGGICQSSTRRCRKMRILAAKRPGHNRRKLFNRQRKKFFIVFPIILLRKITQQNIPPKTFNGNQGTGKRQEKVYNRPEMFSCWLVRFDVVDQERIQVSVQLDRYAKIICFDTSVFRT